MNHFPTFRRRALLVFLLLPSLGEAQTPPPPCTVSILAVGQVNPQKLTNPKDYLARFRGISEEQDKVCREMIATGHEAPVAIPELPFEKPPSPLMVYVDPKTRKALEFSLNLGGVSKRFPVARGQNLDIYLAGKGASSAKLVTGTKRKIHSVPIPESCEEVLAFFIKPPTTSWENYRVVPVDFSPKLIPARSVLILNFSKKPLLVTPEDNTSATLDGNEAQELPPGGRLIYKISPEQSSLRLLYSDPATPDRILCSANCESAPNQRTLVFTFDLGIPENGVEIATRSLQLPVEPVKVEALEGVREMPEGDPAGPE